MTNHRNDERTVRCPVESCDSTPLARGINLHIMRSSGGGHGPQGEVPDHISLEDLETVGERKVEMDYPEERETEQVARLCPYCFQPCKGKNGVLIHLGQVAGRKNHPEDATERHSEEDFPRVKVDNDGNITAALATEKYPPTAETGKGAVSEQQVYHLIADFMARGDSLAAYHVRRHLLGIDVENRPLRKNPSHGALFHTLVEHANQRESTRSVTAALEREGIMVACGTDSAFYNAGEARDVAAGLERATNDKPRDDDIADLIEFLRYGADALDGNEIGRGYHEEFQDWR